MSKAPSRSQDQFIVRLPEGMRDRIKAAAEANNRSMNAEIVATLEEKYPAGLAADAIEEFLTALVQRGSISEENASAVMKRVDAGEKYQIEIDVDDDGAPLGPIRISEV